MYTTRDDVVAALALEHGMSKRQVWRILDDHIMFDVGRWEEKKDGWKFVVAAGTTHQSIIKRL